jgi:hypothetical protein
MPYTVQNEFINFNIVFVLLSYSLSWNINISLVFFLFSCRLILFKKINNKLIKLWYTFRVEIFRLSYLPAT